MFSSTVRSWYSPKRCAMYPIWSFTACDSFAASCPATSALPSVGSISPHSMRSVVVLPAPSGPTSPKISPRATSRFRWSTAVSCAEAPRQVASFDDRFARLHLLTQQNLRIRRHVRFQLVLRILHLDLDPVHQLHPLLLRLNLLRRELRLRRDEASRARCTPCPDTNPSSPAPSTRSSPSPDRSR